MLRRLCAYLPAVAAAATIGLAATTALGATSPKEPTLEVPSATAQSKHVDRTPLEKFLLPSLRNRLGAASSKALLEPAAQPDATNGA